LTYSFFQPALPSSESNINPPEVEGEGARNPGVDVDLDSGPSVQIHRDEVTEVTATTEGRGSQKRRGKHPTTLYECDCGETISGGNIE
jgi:hypothetical protein